MPGPYYPDDRSLYYNLKSGRLIPPAPFFFLKTALAFQGILHFHMNCELFCSSSVKNAIGNFMGIALNLEKEMATHSSVIGWRILLTEEPGRLLSMGLHKVRHD